MNELDNINTPDSGSDDMPDASSSEAVDRIYPLVSVEFKGNRRQLFRNPMEFPFQVGDKVVVRVEKGEDLGIVNHLLERKPEDIIASDYEVLRRATEKDLKTLELYRVREQEAKTTCKVKIEHHGLKMKLVDVEYQFDGRKLIFYFTADGRIDFRQLVKDLAATYRTRIELRQIGTRDEIRRFGGLGPCGRTLCCVTFIKEFCPITTQMAKDQNLPLNPNKISGCCGRLKCCLQYELDTYHSALQKLPRWETRLNTQKGPATVEKLDVFNDNVFLRYQSGDLEMVSSADLDNILSGGFDPRNVEPSVQEPELVNGEIIQDDVENGCSSVNTPSKSPSTQKQRKSHRRRPPHPKKRSGKHLQPQKTHTHNNKTNLKHNNPQEKSDDNKST